MYYLSGTSRIHIFLEKILQALFPMGTYCICCGKYIDLTRPYCLCDQCMTAINWGHITIDLEEERKHSGRTRYLDSAMSCMVYGMHSKRLIFDLKYNKKTFMARPVSMIMADRLTSDEAAMKILGSIDIIVPVPLHESKRKKRGFNQAALISSELALRLKSDLGLSIRHLPDCLKRNRETQAQRSVSGEERFTNLEGAFILNKKYAPLIDGASVLLIDDIFTTGATADRCARILKDAGARDVHFICLATGNYYLRGSFRKRNDEEFLNDL